uniref:J domain-containing protein n=1 Tax=Aegilops tauschii subsp. strangulata TaxID=200361 RepID=A0A453J4D8_AEGTS
MAVTGREGDDDVDHYEVLRLPSGEEGAALSVERIDKAYRTQSRLRHPDDPNATADFQSLASSYKILRDEPLRRQFDARLRGRRTRRGHRGKAAEGRLGPRGTRARLCRPRRPRRPRCRAGEAGGEADGRRYPAHAG